MLNAKVPDTPFYTHLSEALDDLQKPTGMKNSRMGLTDVHMVWLCLSVILHGSPAEINSSCVADWFKRNGFAVREFEFGWLIDLPEEEKEGVVIKK